jgi:MSHA biogenesis protein MshO
MYITMLQKLHKTLSRFTGEGGPSEASGRVRETQQGVTLIELVITMALAAALTVVAGIFIARPITAYTSVTRRAELVDSADMALRRMARDIQNAVPNSLRVKIDPGNPQRIAIEMLNIVEGMRYRKTPAGPFLDFTAPVTQFNVIGQFQFALNNTTCAANACRLVVYNTGANTGGTIPSDNPAAGANVYSTVPAPACAGCLPPPGSVTISPVATTVTLSNPSAEGQINTSAGIQFALPSFRQRIDIVDTPITYICNTAAGQQQITRYWGYTINSVQPTDPSASPLNAAQSAQLTKNVSACSFSYAPGTAQRNGIMTMSLTLSKGGENINLMRQVSVSNAP